MSEESVLVAVESRTSSPVRIPRDPITLEHPSIDGLYPCGEGAGYAGGIISAALDGFRCAVMLGSRLSDQDQWSKVKGMKASHSVISR